MKVVRTTGRIGVVGVYVPEDPGAADDRPRRAGSPSTTASPSPRASMGTGQCPVKSYNRELRDLIIRGKSSRPGSSPIELRLDRAAEGYDNSTSASMGTPRCSSSPDAVPQGRPPGLPAGPVPNDPTAERPNSMGTITGADKNELHYEDTGGTGRPVVLIHGWPLNGKAWKGQVGPLAAAGHRVVTYDRRGFGESEPEHPYGYDALAGDLAALLEALDLREATLVGFSMGGGEVARYVAQHGQERLRSVVFAAAVPPYLLHTGDNPEGPLSKTEAAGMAAQLMANREKFYNDFTTKFFSAGSAVRDRGATAGSDRAVPPGAQAGRARIHGLLRRHRLPGGPQTRHRSHAGAPRRRRRNRALRGIGPTHPRRRAPQRARRCPRCAPRTERLPRQRLRFNTALLDFLAGTDRALDTAEAGSRVTAESGLRPCERRAAGCLVRLSGTWLPP